MAFSVCEWVYSNVSTLEGWLKPNKTPPIHRIEYSYIRSSTSALKNDLNFLIQIRSIAWVEYFFRKNQEMFKTRYKYFLKSL